MKLFINIFLSSNPNKCPILQSAFSCPALLLHNLDMCSSKFSLLSTSRPNNVTFSKEIITFLSIVSFSGLFFWFFLSVIIAWNFYGLTIMELSLTHCVAMFPSFSNTEIMPFSELETQDIVLSSAKLCRSELLIYIKRSFMNKLKRIGPIIEPCGTPDKSNWKILYVLLIWTLCFCRFR